MKPYLIMEHKEKIYNYVIGKVRNNQMIVMKSQQENL